MERVGDPRRCMGPHVLKTGTSVIEQLLAGIGHRRHGCDTVLLGFGQDLLTGLVKCCSLLFQVTVDGSISGPDELILRIVKAGEG